MPFNDGKECWWISNYITVFDDNLDKIRGLVNSHNQCNVMTSIFAGKFGVGTFGFQPKVTMFVTFNGDWRF